MAGAHKAILTFKGAKTGAVFRRNATASDVADDFYTFEDGSDELNLPITENYLLVDVLLTDTGSNTTQVQLYKNQVYIGEQIIIRANQATTVDRQFQVAPIGFMGNSKLKFKQIA